MPLANPFRRQPERPSLRERAADLRAGFARAIRRQEAEPDPAAPAVSFADQIEQAAASGDVLAACGVDHCDGTVSYADAIGRVVRRPLSHWLAFNAQQMHGRVQSEIGRRSIIEANHLPDAERATWEADIRCELRSDAVHALAFRHVRAFETAQAMRDGLEPETQGHREKSDAELLKLAPVWDAAVDLYQQRIDEEEAVCEAAGIAGWPGAAPAGSGPEYRAWLTQKEAWRERTGVAAAEEATSEAGTALHRIELRIAALPAASLAALKLKARVGQRSDDIGVDWPDNLGPGLTRDILAFLETAPVGRPDLTDPNALTAAILDGWGTWGMTLGKPQDDAEANAAYEREAARRDRLLDAAMALPATLESIAPKAIACAWMEWVCTERPGQPRDAYAPADQLVYDLHAAIMKGRPSAGTPRPAASYSYLVERIDFESVSLNELLAIRDIARCIGDAAAAFAWGGRCHQRRNAYGAFEYNAAGQLVTSLSDALTSVEWAAEREVKRREASDEDEQKTRLVMLSPATIDNDDPDEIEALGREILAHAEAIRSRG